MQPRGMEGVALAQLSLYAFLATIVAGVFGGILFLLGQDPASGAGWNGLYSESAQSLLLFAAIVNVISVFSGTIAWVGRGRDCPWVVLGVLLFLASLFVGLQELRVGY
ncbi:MAG: hypothetical protein OER88_07770 [Planctomycetota bacterium]|nr:hypothetical protein [Planctomycetota bacterium]